GREEDLKERLRKIYAAQGIDVPDHVIKQGVAALKEGRFTYAPPPRSLATRLARIYVKRGDWGKWVGGILGVMILAAVIHYVSFVAPDADLPQDLVRVHTEAIALAGNDRARETLERYLRAGQSALRNEDTEGARLALRELEAARTILSQEYSLRIVNRPGERSGVWRIPDLNSGARNYYILVEAVDPTGRVVRVPILNEETRETETVAIWGLRVDEETFNAVARDKQDDGIIERDRFGHKARGELIPRYDMRTTGGAITKW
uniref:DUF6384 family protein n=1 Tax=Thiocapsa sp. TaxID=2024551 RepID=UPI0025F25253